MAALIDRNNENQVEEIISKPCDNLEIKSKLVKEFKEILAAHEFKLNLDLVSSELDPCIKNETAPDIFRKDRRKNTFGKSHSESKMSLVVLKTYQRKECLPNIVLSSRVKFVLFK